MKSLHRYSEFVFITGFRLATLLLGEGWMMYRWCMKYELFRLSAAQMIAPVALRILVLCFAGGWICEYVLSNRGRCD